MEYNISYKKNVRIVMNYGVLSFEKTLLMTLVVPLLFGVIRSYDNIGGTFEFQPFIISYLFLLAIMFIILLIKIFRNDLVKKAFMPKREMTEECLRKSNNLLDVITERIKVDLSNPSNEKKWTKSNIINNAILELRTDLGRFKTVTF